MYLVGSWFSTEKSIYINRAIAFLSMVKLNQMHTYSIYQLLFYNFTQNHYLVSISKFEYQTIHIYRYLIFRYSFFDKQIHIQVLICRDTVLICLQVHFVAIARLKYFTIIITYCIYVYPIRNFAIAGFIAGFSSVIKHVDK